ncbi:MAG: hypothetical protein K1Y36_29050 [Blastocatellia bacterium]|nr:hypothetical protein [Blastocatellia bacterium]
MNQTSQVKTGLRTELIFIRRRVPFPAPANCGENKQHQKNHRLKNFQNSFAGFKQGIRIE